MSSKFEIHSPLPPTDVLARLRENVGADLPLLMWPVTYPSRKLRGWVGEHYFAVRLKTVYGNSFAAVCRGTIESTPTGSLLTAHVGISYVTAFFLVVWTLGVLVSAIHAISQRDGEAALTSVIMLVAGVGLVSFGRRLATGEARGVVQRLREILNAANPTPAA